MALFKHPLLQSKRLDELGLSKFVGSKKKIGHKKTIEKKESNEE